MIFEAAHLLGIVPIVVLILAGRGLPPVYGWVAMGLGVSWVGDMVGHRSGGSWYDWEWWPMTQFAVLIWGLGKGLWRDVGMTAVMLAAAAAVALPRLGPDWFVAATGSAVVLLMVRGPLMGPMWVYFGAGTLAIPWMISTIGPHIWPAWLTYQGARAVAVAWFAVAVIRARRVPVTAGGR